MSQFSRRARWLNQIFPASRAPQVRDPADVSSDVSLVQPYDGSGWGLIDPSQILKAVNVGVGAVSGEIAIFTCGVNNIARIIGASVQDVVGAVPAQVGLELQDLAGGLRTCGIAVGPETPFAHVKVDNPLDVYCPIVPPGFTVAGTWQGGDAATRLTFQLAVVEVPVGTVFYV